MPKFFHLVISLCFYSFGFGKEIITVSISRIIDGDTIEVLKDSEKIKIRLYGIDAPERAPRLWKQFNKSFRDNS